jgi:pilus assembly protein Flp/PilA
LPGLFLQLRGGEVVKSLALGIKRFLKDEEGVTMVEYGLLAALIAIVCIAAITAVGTELNIVFQYIADSLANATP